MCVGWVLYCRGESLSFRMVQLRTHRWRRVLSEWVYMRYQLYCHDEQHPLYLPCWRWVNGAEWAVSFSVHANIVCEPNYLFIVLGELPARISIMLYDPG